MRHVGPDALIVIYAVLVIRTVWALLWPWSPVYAPTEAEREAWPQEPDEPMAEKPWNVGRPSILHTPTPGQDITRTLFP